MNFYGTDRRSLLGACDASVGAVRLGAAHVPRRRLEGPGRGNLRAARQGRVRHLCRDRALGGELAGRGGRERAHSRSHPAAPRFQVPVIKQAATLVEGTLDSTPRTRTESAARTRKRSCTTLAHSRRSCACKKRAEKRTMMLSRARPLALRTLTRQQRALSAAPQPVY